MKIFIVSHTTIACPHMPNILVFVNEENALKHYDDLVRLGYQSESTDRLADSDVQFEECTIMDSIPAYEPFVPEVTEPTFADFYA